MDSVRWSGWLSGWERGGGDGPLYVRLAGAVRQRIHAGQLGVGERLPAERALAGLLGVSRSTVVAAYDRLAEDGWVTRRRGSGTHVAAGAPRQAGVLSLRTPLAPAAPPPADELDFTIAVPLLTPAHQAEMQRAAQAGFQESLYHPLGLPALRAALAQQYSAEGLPTRPDQIIVTSGAQQGIALLAGALLRRDDRALLESPTFFGAIDVFRASGAHLIGLPVGPHGVSAQAFLEAAARHTPRLAFLTPTFQNPTGTLMPAPERERLAQGLARVGLPTIEDDTLVDLSFGTPVPPRLAHFAPAAPIVNVGSFSKLYWSGLRVGWMRVPDSLHAPLAQAKTLADFGSSLPTQHLALHLLRALPRLRQERCRAVIQARDLLAELLRAHLPEWSFHLPQGGQFLWVELPQPQASAFTHVAARYGVRLFPGASMGVDQLPDRYLRLPFTLDPARLPEAARRLSAAWAEFRSRQGHPLA